MTPFTSCFNEAAVHHGGSVLKKLLANCERAPASTRPPFITADRSRSVTTAKGLSRASTRPPFITADRRQTHGPRSHTRVASTRPPFITADRLHAPPHDTRGAWRASTRPPFITADRVDAFRDVFRELIASTRPPFITADRTKLRCKLGVSYALQRGRRSSRRIGRPASSVWNAGLMLQRGRRSSRRIGRCTCVSMRPTGCFNEAAVHHGGSVSGVAGAASVVSASTRPPFITADRSTAKAQQAAAGSGLQRGRRSSRRIGIAPTCLRTPSCRRASTRPPFITADREFARAYSSRSASTMCPHRFNEAAVHHGGSGNYYRQRRIEGHASTRPPFITADRTHPRRNRRRPRPRFNEAAVHHGGSGLLPRNAGGGYMRLQRGRRSSRRIGWASRFVLPVGSPRFNEAAVHHGGSEAGIRGQCRYCSGFNEAAVHHGGSAAVLADVT